MNMEGIYFKPDPETVGASPGALSDDDIYEETGDLEFNPDPAFQNIYLARIPKYLWQVWSELDDDTEIHLGTVRITTITESDGTKKVLLALIHCRCSSTNAEVARYGHAPQTRPFLPQAGAERIRTQSLVWRGQKYIYLQRTGPSRLQI